MGTERPVPDQEVRGFLGLAHRAGAAIPGVEAVRQALRAGDACLVILAGDAAAGQLKKVMALLEHRDVPLRWMDRRDTLGSALGRDALSAVAITNESFAEQLLSRLPARTLRGTGLDQGGRGPKEESSTDAGR